MAIKSSLGNFGINLIPEEEMMMSRDKDYYILPISKKEKSAMKRAKFEILEVILIETWKGFLLHHFRHFRTKDGKVLALRSNGGERIIYDAPKLMGQQKSTCAQCEEDVLLHIDFEPGDVQEKSGAYCADCQIDHPIPIIFIDLDFRFKTVYKPNKGAMLTTGDKAGVLRSYCGDAWKEKDKLEFGDSYVILRVVEDNSGLFSNNDLFVKTIKGPIVGPVKGYLKFKDEIEINEINETDQINKIDTMTLVCENCGIVLKLSNEELEDVSNFISKHNLKGIDALNYMNLLKGRMCKKGLHKFKFDDKYIKLLHDIIDKNKDITKQLDELISKKQGFEKERDETVTEQINKMRIRDELVKSVEEINGYMGLLVIKMDDLTKNIDIESDKITNANDINRQIKERLYQLTRTSDLKLWDILEEKDKN